MGAVLYVLCGVARGQLITTIEAQKYRKKIQQRNIWDNICYKVK